MAVSISGCVLSALLFKLKNVTADGVSPTTSCPYSPRNFKSYALTSLGRKAFSWEKSTLTVWRISLILRVLVLGKRRGYASALTFPSTANTGLKLSPIITNLTQSIFIHINLYHRIPPIVSMTPEEH